MIESFRVDNLAMTPILLHISELIYSPESDTTKR